ncbi:S9 family peptidase [Haloparvum alkalitolerans]|uniref:S9 family peptidase n=1 Tax=Haloparvum alkalitolerans TaxID=1042953 RepID=UPI003CE84CA2
MTELPLDAYYDLTQVGEVAVSPSGDRVAFTATEYDQSEDESVTSLFVVPRDGSRDPHRLSRASDAGSPAWSPDGERLAFTAAREEDDARRVGWQDRATDENADEADEADAEETNGEDAAEPENADDEPKSQVWVFDLALGGDARQVTDREEGVSEFDWGPEGDRLVVAARDPTDEESDYLDQVRDGGPVETTRMQHKLDGVGWTDDVTTYLFVVDAETGEEIRLEDGYGGGAQQDLSGMNPHWGEAGRIAFTAYRGEDPDDTSARDVYTIRPEADAEAVRQTDGTLSCAGPRWRSDGTLGFVASVPDNWCLPTQVYVGEPGKEQPAGDPGAADAEGAGSFASITEDLDRTVARGGGVHWVDGAVYTLIADHSRTRLVRADPAEKAVDRVFEAQGNLRAVSALDVSADGSTAAFVLSHPGEGADVYAVDVADLDDAPAAEPHHPADDPEGFPEEPGSITRLSGVNDDLIAEFSMPEVERVEWESDGWDLDGVLYHDPDVDPEAGDHPLAVAIHGGPISYDEPVFSFAHAALTSRGYLVFRPNYRGGSSRGREFAETLRGQWGTVEVADVVAGARSLVERGWADGDRIFGYGFSYGGITQGFIVTQEPDLFAAAAPEHGIYDLRSAFGTDDSHNWMEAEYGLPWENPEAIDASSAILDAGNIDTPVLITAGGQDWRCPPSQSEQFYMAAQKAGVDAKLIVYPEEHHNVGDPDRAIHRLEAVTEWYETHDPATESDPESDEE